MIKLNFLGFFIDLFILISWICFGLESDVNYIWDLLRRIMVWIGWLFVWGIEEIWIKLRFWDDFNGFVFSDYERVDIGFFWCWCLNIFFICLFVDVFVMKMSGMVFWNFIFMFIEDIIDFKFFFDFIMLIFLVLLIVILMFFIIFFVVFSWFCKIFLDFLYFLRLEEFLDVMLLINVFLIWLIFWWSCLVFLLMILMFFVDFFVYVFFERLRFVSVFFMFDFNYVFIGKICDWSLFCNLVFVFEMFMNWCCWWFLIMYLL